MNFDTSPNDIAVVGLSCRFPGAESAAAFWQNLKDGVESIARLSAEQLDQLGVPKSVREHESFVNAAPLLDGIDQFDARFFGYAPKEAQLLAPEHRLFLETAYHALESADIAPDHYEGLIGVYAGMGLSTYMLFNLLNNPDLDSAEDSYAVMLGNDKDFLSTRVSYHLNLKGPSIDVQTGCSTALVATHLACDALLSYQCDVALAGGVTVEMPQRAGYVHQKGGITSPDGHCRPFDADGRGTLFGSGVGIVVLKRLQDALNDGDMIHAIIKGTAINNDGALKLGYTAPSVEGQAEVIHRAQAIAGVTPESIGLIEGHGTATELGDPIEFAALTQVFKNQTDKKQFCALGSVKSNIGHLDAAAGAAGLIKAILSLRQQTIPPTLHFEQPNAAIDLANSPFFVNTAAQAWPRNGTPRRAGVSSFGIGGTNAHVVLEEAPTQAPSAPNQSWQLVTISGKSQTAITNFSDNLSQQPSGNLADLTYSLQIGRNSHPHRRTCVVSDLADLNSALTDPSRWRDGVAPGQTRPIFYLFSGQGSQYAGMAHGLYQTEPVFRQAVDECAASLLGEMGDIRPIIFSEDGATLKQTQYAQPAIFVIEYALAQLLESVGVKPSGFLGHSIGEYVAACLAGVFSLADALKVVAARGRLMQQMASGAMLAVPLAEDAIQPLLNGALSLAVINGEANCVVAGPQASIDKLAQQLDQNAVKSRPLHTSHAFHSAMMEPALAPFKAVLNQVTLNAPNTPFISNVTGGWIAPAEATSRDYWVSHIRQTVRFADGLQLLLQEKNAILLEVGGGHTLTTLAQQKITASGAETSDYQLISTLRHPKQKEDDRAKWLDSIGRLWLAGVPIQWQALYLDQRRRRVPLPRYPFERQRYWIDPPAEGQTRFSAKKRLDFEQWFSIPSWKRGLPSQHTFTDQHWLIFCDAHGLVQPILNHLQKHNQQITQVHFGDGFLATDSGFVIDAANSADFTQLFQTLGDNLPQHVIYAGGLGSPTEPTQLCFEAPLFLVQALGQTIAPDAIRLTFMSSGGAAVTGAETLQPQQALVQGPAIVVNQELEHVVSRTIDVDLKTLARHAAGIVADCATADDDLIAYRGAYRWSREFESVELSESAEINLKQNGVYLITGGSGGLGLTMARYLAESFAARLVLLSRSGHVDVAVLDELSALGADVLVVSADIADKTQLTQAIAQAESRFGRIDGVVHAAGVAGGGLIQMKTAEAAQAVLAPKVQGTLNLASCFQDALLDWMVLFSSTTGTLGGVGQIDYAAANAFLDCFAHANAPSMPIVAINWDEWQQVGMAVNADLPAYMQQWRLQELRHAITPAEGQQVFERVLRHLPPQLYVTTRHLPALVQRSKANTLANLLAQLEQSRQQSPVSTSSAKFVAPTNAIEAEIVAIWQEVLGVEQIGIYDSFFELGGNSLVGLKLIQRLNATFDIDIPAVSLYEQPTVQKLTELVTQLQTGVETAAATFEQDQDRGARRREKRRKRRKKT